MAEPNGRQNRRATKRFRATGCCSTTASFRRARYVARTLLLPGPHHIAAMPLPGTLTFAYVPVKLAHDLIALPLWHAWSFAAAQAERFGYAVMDSRLPLAAIPVSRPTRSAIQRYRETRKAAMRALEADPADGSAWADLGNAMFGVQRYGNAIDCYDMALSTAPDNSIIWKMRRAAMKASGKKPEFPAVALNPQDAKAWAVRAGALLELDRITEAADASDRALELDPVNTAAARIGIHSRLLACDWQRIEEDKQRISDELRAGRCIVSRAPSQYMRLGRENLLLARHWAGRIASPCRSLLRHGPAPRRAYGHDKIRVAYLSSDFRNHVVAQTIARCLELHDRTRFEITAVSLIENEGSDMSRRIEAASDRYMDVHSISDAEVATMLRGLEIDIAIDLNGYTREKRTGIFAGRPAPVQVNYLGYPGTMGVPFIDYIIADRIVIPEEHAQFYGEKVVYMPDTYMPTDNTRVIGETDSKPLRGGTAGKRDRVCLLQQPAKIRSRYL